MDWRTSAVVWMTTTMVKVWMAKTKVTAMMSSKMKAVFNAVRHACCGWGNDIGYGKATGGGGGGGYSVCAWP